eukprot:GHVU01168647.1.p2 GENE.GHVU01168647.1~~GHVU01168647.1.p2  ORF type:complete len:139 (+),score=21.96 GHVU01168647.1:27-419(+)
MSVDVKKTQIEALRKTTTDRETEMLESERNLEADIAKFRLYLHARDEKALAATKHVDDLQRQKMEKMQKIKSLKHRLAVHLHAVAHDGHHCHRVCGLAPPSPRMTIGSAERAVEVQGVEGRMRPTHGVPR